MNVRCKKYLNTCPYRDNDEQGSCIYYCDGICDNANLFDDVFDIVIALGLTKDDIETCLDQER